jgi:hypothetical protein
MEKKVFHTAPGMYYEPHIKPGSQKGKDGFDNQEQRNFKLGFIIKR